MDPLAPPPFRLAPPADRVLKSGRTPTDPERASLRSLIKTAETRNVVIGLPDYGEIQGTPTAASQFTLRLDPNVRVPQDGTLTSCTFYGEIAGSATIVTLAKAGTKYTVKRTQAITVPGVGFATVPLSLDVDEGDIVAVHLGLGSMRQGVAFATLWTGNQLHTLSSVPVPSGTFVPAGPFGVSLQINYTVSYLP